MSNIVPPPGSHNDYPGAQRAEDIAAIFIAAVGLSAILAGDTGSGFFLFLAALIVWNPTKRN